jgi:hypothetical protein
MQDYILRAELKGNITSFPIKARGTSGAVVEANNIIRRCSVSDKRIAEGDITLMKADSTVIMTIIGDEETMHTKKGGEKIESK